MHDQATWPGPEQIMALSFVVLSLLLGVTAGALPTDHSLTKPLTVACMLALVAAFVIVFV